MSQFNNTDPGIIVLGGHIQALGIIRILGREGVKSIILDHNKKNIARHSKYCHQFIWSDKDKTFETLLNIANEGKHKGWILFPTNDAHVKLLSKNKKVLSKDFRVSTDDWYVVSNFHNKKLTYPLAESLNIPIPKTFFPNDLEALDKLDIQYPCIVKPAIMFDFYSKTKKKVFYCKDKQDLQENYKKACQYIPQDEVIIQEVIMGPGQNQFSACFLVINGIVYEQLTACRMRQHPLDFGNATTYAETVDIPELVILSKKILEKVNYTGLCEVEFKLDRQDQSYKFLEVNPRTWKWHSIANKTNTHFLKSYYDYLYGKPIEPNVQKLKKASFYHFITDSLVSLKMLIKGRKNAFRFSGQIEHAVWASDDIKPWFYEKIYLFYLIKTR